MKVLIVDDDRFQVDSIRRGLGLYGHVAVATGVGRALEVLVAAGPAGFDVAIVDLGVPAGARMAVVSRVRRLVPPLPVLVLAGLATSPDLAAARSLGGTILRKPFDAAALDRAIRAAVQRADPTDEPERSPR